MSFEVVSMTALSPPSAPISATSNGFVALEPSAVASSTPYNRQQVTMYRHVYFNKFLGNLELTWEGIAFSPSNPDAIPSMVTSPNNNNNNFSLPWSSIVKQQVSPPNYHLAMLKLITNENPKGFTFQLSDREELQRLRQDVTDRIKRYGQNNHSNGQSAARFSGGVTATTASATAGSTALSGKKRPHFEMNRSSSTRLLKGITELDSTALAVTRSSILAKNPSLRSQHQFLVEEAKIVSEDDFWKTHDHLLQEEYAGICGIIRAGTSSLLQSHLALQGRVTLGVEEMRQIFILYPAVHKAYEEKVPLELSDEQFWRKYLESEYFHRDRGRLGTAARNHAGSIKKVDKAVQKADQQEARAAAVGTDDLFSRYDQKMKEHLTTAAANRKWGTNLAVGQFDLASTFQTERGDLLEAPRDNHPPNAVDDGKGARVIQKYNRHWAMVLHSEEATAGSKLLDVARQSVHDVLEDDEDAKARGGLDKERHRLVDFASASEADSNHAQGISMLDSDTYKQLKLKNVEAYYSGAAQQQDTSLKQMEEKSKKFKMVSQIMATKTIDLWKKNKQQLKKQEGDKSILLLQNCFPQQDLATRLLAALTKKFAEDSNTNAHTLERVQDLPEDFKQRLHSYFLRSSELLRHFFDLRNRESQGNSSSIKTKSEMNESNLISKKLQKIVSGMETFYREMEVMRKELPQTETGEMMRKMCNPIMDQLDWAFKLHREGSGGGGRGGGFVSVEEF